MLAMAGENDHANGGVLACYHPVSDKLLPNISIDDLWSNNFLGFTSNFRALAVSWLS